jgi:hypothetical protein
VTQSGAFRKRSPGPFFLQLRDLPKYRLLCGEHTQKVYTLVHSWGGSQHANICLQLCMSVPKPLEKIGAAFSATTVCRLGTRIVHKVVLPFWCCATCRAQNNALCARECLLGVSLRQFASHALWLRMCVCWHACACLVCQGFALHLSQSTLRARGGALREQRRCPHIYMPPRACVRSTRACGDCAAARHSLIYVNSVNMMTFTHLRRQCEHDDIHASTSTV